MASAFTLSSPRLRQILDAWSARKESGDAVACGCSALVALFGELSANTLENQRGQAMVQYLLGSSRPVANVAVFLTASRTVIIRDESCSISASAMEGHDVTVVSTADEGNVALQSLGLQNRVVGVAKKELAIQEGTFATSMVSLIDRIAPGDLSMEAAPLLGELLFCKDEVAMSSIEKAAGLCSAVFRRYARQLIEDQIIAASPKTLGAMREELCERLEHPQRVNGLESLNVSEFSMASGLTPCIFQKGSYVPQLQVGVEKLESMSNTPFCGDVVVVRYGAKNFGHTAYLSRTLIVSTKAPLGAKEAYQFLHNLSDHIIASLVVGAKLSTVYTSAMEYAHNANADLAAHLQKSFGFSTGLLVLEARGSIAEKGTAIVSNGMGFVVRVVLENIPDGSGGTYDMEIADTVLVRNGAADLKTKVTRKVADITYEDEEQAEAFQPSEARDLSKITRQGVSNTITMSSEAKRDELLRNLLRELHAELLAAGGKKGMQTSTEEFRVFELGKLSFGELNPFGSTGPVPLPHPDGGIAVQSDKKVLWVPIFGQAVPFHISTISKCDAKVEGTAHTFNITFHSLQEANVSYKLNRTKVFLKELNYTSQRPLFNDIKLQIQAIQQRIKNEDAARKRSGLTATFGKLIIGKILGLPQVKLRPPVTVGRQNKGCAGNLELHQNGLRFQYLGGAPIDILFDNIKHTIFQPSIQEICVIYHITLKKAIELGRKSVAELQFVAEVMESSEAATGVRRSHEEEVAAEMRDEERARNTNKQFISFAQAVERQSKIKAQLPISNFSFDGVHTRSMVKFRGSRDVLWAVSDWPAFTMSVQDIEVVSLERVMPGGSTFDISFVLKDYSKPVVSINSVPRQFLEGIKDWCLSVRLYYMETTVNPNWRVTLKEIREDAEWDPWMPGAGWSVLNNDADDQDSEEGDSDSDSTYYEDDSDEEDDDSDDSSWLEDEESDVDESDADDDSSAVSWDELERKALEQDRKRSFNDEDEGRPRKRVRSAGPEGTDHTPPIPRPPTKAVPFGKTAVPPPRRF